MSSISHVHYILQWDSEVSMLHACLALLHNNLHLLTCSYLAATTTTRVFDIRSHIALPEDIFFYCQRTTKLYNPRVYDIDITQIKLEIYFLIWPYMCARFHVRKDKGRQLYTDPQKNNVNQQDMVMKHSCSSLVPLTLITPSILLFPQQTEFSAVRNILSRQSN